jgi:hypothetical protein
VRTIMTIDVAKDGERRDVITAPRFAELKETALEALEC